MQTLNVTAIMRITQVIQGVHISSAGPTYSVARLASELRTLGDESSVITLGIPPSEWPHSAPIRVHSGNIERATGVSPTMMRDIHRESKNSCIIHGHGIWRIANLFPLLVSRDAPARIVYSPRGTLSSWSMQYKSLIKKPFWVLLQKPALARCHCLHATSDAEHQDIRRVGLEAPVAVIPNGIDIPAIDEHLPRKNQVVYLSRINPVKGVDLLIKAWIAVHRHFKNWELVIAGPLDNEYAQSMVSLASALKAEAITFVGETLGDEKRSLLSRASLFILPSYSENFGIAVAEALAHGTPVITTTGTPWLELDRKNAGWCIAPAQSAIEDSLRMALSRPPAELHEMGCNGRAWMQKDYSWEPVTEQMRQAYSWLLGQGDMPDCIRLS